MVMVGGFGAAKPADEEVAALLAGEAVAAAIAAAAGAGAVAAQSYKTQVVRALRRPPRPCAARTSLPIIMRR